MRFSGACLAAALLAAPSMITVSAEQADGTCDNAVAAAPFVKPTILCEGNVVELSADNIEMSDVQGCCGVSSNQDASDSLTFTREVIGQMPQMDSERAMEELGAAKQAWNNGMGTWPQMSLKERADAIESFLMELTSKREDIVNTLMWEIGKNRKDAEAEFDRTMEFCAQVLDVVRNDPEYSSGWQTFGSTKAFVRRAAIGIVMCLGPMNYPLNETYSTLIPALLMGNVAIMKIPTVGGLAHLLTMEAFAKTLPVGVMNFVSGRGRDTMPVLMETGEIDALAFVGGTGAADDLIRKHPEPHRLKTFLQLEAKNMGIFMSDLFTVGKEAELAHAMDQATLGALSFNGQRCTAVKLLFVPEEHGDTFAQKLVERVEALSVGLPWQSWPQPDGSAPYSSITPLPNQSRVEHMKHLIEDAVSKGAKVMNKRGGEIVGGPDSTLMIPAVLYPVSFEMEVYHEEQFGPVVPIAPYESLDTLVEFAREGIYGQQVSIFLSEEEKESTATLVDKFSSIFGKINLNSQCGRSPDTLAFSGRRSSAMGVMSVNDALREFSIPTVLSYKESTVSGAVLEELERSAKFLQPLN